MVHLPVSLCIYICEPACGECFPLPPDPAFTRPRPRPGGPRPSAQLPSPSQYSRSGVLALRGLLQTFRDVSSKISAKVVWE